MVKRSARTHSSVELGQLVDECISCWMAYMQKVIIMQRIGHNEVYYLVIFIFGVDACAMSIEDHTGNICLQIIVSSNNIE